VATPEPWQPGLQRDDTSAIYRLIRACAREAIVGTASSRDRARDFQAPFDSSPTLRQQDSPLALYLPAPLSPPLLFFLIMPLSLREAREIFRERSGETLRAAPLEQSS